MLGLMTWAKRIERGTRQLSGMRAAPGCSPHELLLRLTQPFRGHRPRIEGQLQSNGQPIHLVGNETTKEAVSELSEYLRFCYRKRIVWEETIPQGNSSWLEYCHVYLLAPILQIFNCLRLRIVEDDIVSHVEQIDDGLLKMWFTCRDFANWEDDAAPPTIIVSPRPLPCHEGVTELGDALPPLLRSITSATPLGGKAKTIITDLDNILVVHPRLDGSPSIPIEIMPMKSDLRIFRIIVAAYLHDGIPKCVYIAPPTDPVGPYSFWLPPRTYDSKLLTDDEVFRTRHRNSDFDLRKMIEQREDALQFFRWKRFVADTVSPAITLPGDEIVVSTKEFDKLFHPPRGIYSEPLPQPTLDHTERIRRPNPLDAGVRSALHTSKSFTVRLGARLNPQKGDSEVVARVHLCHLCAIDGASVQNPTPTLVMKVFDDRFLRMSSPYDEDSKDMSQMREEELHFWFQSFFTAEWHVRGELTAYEKMAVGQGALIPYFYGAHKFRLESGHCLYGVLMEHVPDAPPLDSGILRQWSDEQKKQLMISIRHGLRLMQRSDVSQHDWHPGQLLCRLHPVPHAVFVDFSATTQTVDLDEELAKDDYGRCLGAIDHASLGLDPKWMNEQWNRPDMARETWDTNNFMFAENGYKWTSKAKDPFAFVYERAEHPPPRQL